MMNEDLLTQIMNKQMHMLAVRIFDLLEEEDYAPVVSVLTLERMLLSGYQSVVMLDSDGMKQRFGEMVDAWMGE